MRGFRRRSTFVLATLVCLSPSAAVAQAKPGDLLVASRKVTNTRFAQTVVLLLKSGPTGAAGLVLNRPGNVTLAKLFPNAASAQGRTDTAFWGGPVGGKQVFCLVQVNAALREGQLVLPHVYVSTTPALMDLALNAQRARDTFRVYVGFTGWARDQLERELKAGLWVVRPATATEIFDPAPATLWSRLSAAAGPKPRPQRHPIDILMSMRYVLMHGTADHHSSGCRAAERGQTARH